MNTTSRARLLTAAYAAAIAVSLVWISPFPASAQLGSLIVTMTAPASGSTVGGTVTVSASVTIVGALTVRGVQFKLDGINLGAEDTTAPYSVPWNTIPASNGSHTLTAVARDLLGATWAATPVTVTVFNDKTAPTVAIASPASGATVSGTTSVTANASDNVGVAGVQFFVDGALLGAEDTTAPYSTTWTTTTASNASHTLTARARDAAGNTATSAVTVTVFNDTTPPTVAITSPASGATLSGTASVTANASDNVGVAGVQFKLDGANLGAEDTAAPYAVSWDTTAAGNGTHTLTAVARDTGGNTVTATAVSVSVANGGGGGSTIRIEDNTTGVSYANNWTLNFSGGSGGWSGGSTAFSVVQNARATLSFNGNGVRWIGVRAPYVGIANVYLDGTAVATVDGYAPAETIQAVLYTSPTLAAGLHTLTIEVTRTRNPSSADFMIFVDAFDVMGAPTDTTPPTVGISAPATGTRVSGSVTVNADASDNVAVVGVQFLVDGSPLGPEDISVPYTLNWTTTNVPDGSHTLTAIARDGAGNTARSADVTVSVANASAPQLATRLENTSLSITYTSGVTAPGQPGDWFQGSRSRTWSGDTASFNRSAGARATLAFTGTSASWIGFRAPWAGIARVYVDGAFVTELDLFSTTEEVQTPVFTALDLPAGSHTLTVESTGRKNDAAVDYAVVVDAFDVAPPFPPPQAGTRFEETAPSTTFTAGWSQGDATKPWSGGTAAVSATPPTPGARATFAFTGTSVSWIGVRSPRTGIARVYLDGAFHATVDTYSPTEIQAVVYTATGLAPGRHALAIEVTGDKNAASTDSRICLDAFDIRSRFEDTDSSVTFTGTWLLQTTERASSGTSLNTGSGTAARSNTAGSRADFVFTGTSVTWIGFRGPWIGMADVSLDGNFVSRVDLYSPTEQVQAAVFAASGLSAGRHTLTIVVAGQQNPSSTGAWVMIDAFDAEPTPASAVTRMQETDPSVVLTANWTSAGVSSLWSGRTARQTTTVGERATFTFTGTSVRWLGERGFDTGVARVSIDGVFITQVDTRTATQEEYQAALFTATGLTAGSHTLTIDVIGRNNEPPGATVQRVVVDAFEVY